MSPDLSATDLSIDAGRRIERVLADEEGCGFYLGNYKPFRLAAQQDPDASAFADEDQLKSVQHPLPKTFVAVSLADGSVLSAVSLMQPTSEARGRGPGSVFKVTVERAVEEMRPQGKHLELKTVVYASDTSTIAFYEKCGFVARGSRQSVNHLKDSEPVVELDMYFEAPRGDPGYGGNLVPWLHKDNDKYEGDRRDDGDRDDDDDDDREDDDPLSSKPASELSPTRMTSSAEEPKTSPTTTDEGPGKATKTMVEKTSPETSQPAASATIRETSSDTISATSAVTTPAGGDPSIPPTETAPSTDQAPPMPTSETSESISRAVTSTTKTSEPTGSRQPKTTDTIVPGTGSVTPPAVPAATGSETPEGPVVTNGGSPFDWPVSGSGAQQLGRSLASLVLGLAAVAALGS
ncbi:hypothetical protein DL771_010074 [Monosporascus sp. 5C6A]|nr:hypothetical protein DL771_010074 [Monosporascus sp. 5C6A]